MFILLCVQSNSHMLMLSLNVKFTNDENYQASISNNTMAFWAKWSNILLFSATLKGSFLSWCCVILKKPILLDVINFKSTPLPGIKPYRQPCLVRSRVAIKLQLSMDQNLATRKRHHRFCVFQPTSIWKVRAQSVNCFAAHVCSQKCGSLFFEMHCHINLPWRWQNPLCSSLNVSFQSMIPHADAWLNFTKNETHHRDPAARVSTPIFARIFFEMQLRCKKRMPLIREWPMPKTKFILALLGRMGAIKLDGDNCTSRSL